MFLEYTAMFLLSTTLITNENYVTVSGNTVSGNSVAISAVEETEFESNDKTSNNENNENSSYFYTIEQFSKDKKEVENKKIKYKKIACIGDSITEGAGGDKLTDGSYKGYCECLESITSVDVVNLGKGGAPIGDYWDDTSISRRWNTIPTDSDCIILFAGYNDFFIGKYDEFCIYLEELFLNLKTEYKKSDIYIVLPYHIQHEYNLPYSLNNLSKYINAINKEAQNYDFRIIDLYNTNFMNTNDRRICDLYASDGVHLNSRGYEILAYRIANCLCY